MRYLLYIVSLGSLWGVLEATLGGALANFPYHGAVMANIGLMIIAGGFTRYERNGLALGVGVVAASFKLLDVVIFQVPIFAKMIINPIIAILVEAAAFEVAIAIIWRRFPESKWAKATSGAFSMYLAYLGISWGFLFVTKQGPPALYRIPWIKFVLHRGSIAGLFALVTIPLVDLVEGFTVRHLSSIQLPRKTYYGLLSGSIALFWTVGVLWKIIA